MTIRNHISPNLYTYTPSPIGRLLLCGDEERLSGLYTAPASGDPDLVRDQRRASAPFVRVREQLEAYFAGERIAFDVPLNLDGATAFFASVWRHLLAIPFGTTVTYGELAKRLGRPTAARAVGMANGRNPIAIIVPCHRVVGSGGGLTGYAGGLERKRYLLRHEADVLIVRRSRSEVAALEANGGQQPDDREVDDRPDVERDAVWMRSAEWAEVDQDAGQAGLI
jgi:methylated-DNA-[protein]-cysteine S-methyltransferase